tara:strand:- start:858 stop:1142 length:285 start_codon:yes stop_codon:yes gene_type:complete
VREDGNFTTTCTPIGGIGEPGCVYTPALAVTDSCIALSCAGSQVPLYKILPGGSEECDICGRSEGKGETERRERERVKRERERSSQDYNIFLLI